MFTETVKKNKLNTLLIISCL